MVIPVRTSKTSLFSKKRGFPKLMTVLLRGGFLKGGGGGGSTTSAEGLSFLGGSGGMKMHSL